VAPRVPYPGVRYPASLSFSDVRRLRAEVRRVRHCVPASAGRCILRGRRLRGRVRWAWVQHFRLRERRGLAAVRAVQRDGLVSAMFRAA
jgi:hypothetical protein